MPVTQEGEFGVIKHGGQGEFLVTVLVTVPGPTPSLSPNTRETFTSLA